MGLQTHYIGLNSALVWKTEAELPHLFYTICHFNVLHVLYSLVGYPGHYFRFFRKSLTRNLYRKKILKMALRLTGLSGTVSRSEYLEDFIVFLSGHLEQIHYVFRKIS